MSAEENFFIGVVVVSSPLLAKEGAGGGIGLLQMFFNLHDDPYQIIIDIIIPEAQYCVAEVLNVCGSI